MPRESPAQKAARLARERLARLRESGQGLPKETREAFFGGQPTFHSADPDRPNLNPERWEFNRSQAGFRNDPEDALIAKLSELSSERVLIHFQAESPNLPNKRAYEPTYDNVYWLSANLDREDLMDALRTSSVAQVMSRAMGFRAGTITDVPRFEVGPGR